MSGSGNVSCNRVFIGLGEITPPPPPRLYTTIQDCVCALKSAFARAHVCEGGGELRWEIKKKKKMGGREEKRLWDRSSTAGLVSAYALQEFPSTIFSTHSTHIL